MLYYGDAGVGIQEARMFFNRLTRLPTTGLPLTLRIIAPSAALPDRRLRLRIISSSAAFVALATGV